MITKSKVSEITLGSTTYKVDSRILEMFTQKSGDKLEKTTDIAAGLVTDGKRVDRALADALEVLNLL